MQNTIHLNAFGEPADVCSCDKAPWPDVPAATEIQVDILAAPINPAEMLLIKGLYAAKPPLPARLGIEGVGRVVAVGDKVTALAPDDLVMCMTRQNWCQRLNIDTELVVKLPAGIDVLQASMLKVNPATASMMLSRFVDLSAGDWVIQNAANSGVGHYLIQIAKTRGIHTINVVRREELIAPLQNNGADCVIVDGDDLAKRVAAEIGEVEVKLAIDAVAGMATKRLADCLADGGTVVNYGMLSGDPCMITAEQTIFRDILLRGFWLSKTLPAMPRADVAKLYAELSSAIQGGQLRSPIDSCYDLTDIGKALAHADRSGRNGKILLTPNDL